MITSMSLLSASPSPVVKCGERISFLNMKSNNITCPDSCAFLAEIKYTNLEDYCSFMCVSPEQCGRDSTGEATDPLATVADSSGSRESWRCRRCSVPRCDTCSTEHREDYCKTCDRLYKEVNGLCVYQYLTEYWGCLSVLGGLLLTLLLWLTCLCFRRISNKEGLAEGLAFRERTLLRPGSIGYRAIKDAETRALRYVTEDFKSVKSVKSVKSAKDIGPTPLWPLTTNLFSIHRGLVGGVGLILHFDYQLAIIVWSALVTVTWAVVTLRTGMAHYTQGWETFQTPLELCASIKADPGLKQREHEQWLQLQFLGAIYSGTFLASIVYSGWQRHRFDQVLDAPTMQDFVAICQGLPEMDGEENVEVILKEFFEDALEEHIVGVSVCWRFGAKIQQVSAAADALSSENAMSQPSTTGMRKTCWARFISSIDALFLGFDAEAQVDSEGTVRMLRDLKTSNTAFIVFESELSRDKAIFAANRLSKFSKICFRERQLRFRTVEYEPQSVVWWSYGCWPQFFLRLFSSFAMIFLAMLLWALLFWFPYSWYLASSKFYTTFWNQTVLSILVAVGNQIMYFVCFSLSQWIGFNTIERCEQFYLLTYLLACLVNVMLDLALTARLTREALQGPHFAGQAFFSHYIEWVDLINSIPVQKALGQQLFIYSFPSCFLMPFVCEAIFSWLLPWKVQKLLVGSHAELRGEAAEKALAFPAPMTLLRYADIQLNVMLATISFTLTSELWMTTFVALFFCHLFILVYDHFHVLRGVPSFEFSTNIVDVTSQALMAIPCGLLLSNLVWRYVCLMQDSEDGDPEDARGDPDPGGPGEGWFPIPRFQTRGEARLVLMACIAFFALHVLVHLLLLYVLIPMLPRRGHKNASLKYQEVAGSTAASWFTLNPVHCLRSKYIYQHYPPCSYWRCGKEHLMKANPAIGTFFGSRARRTICDRLSFAPSIELRTMTRRSWSDVPFSDALSQGCMVRIHNLRHKSKLNGEQGTCMCWDDDLSAWEVKLITGERIFATPKQLEYFQPRSP